MGGRMLYRPTTNVIVRIEMITTLQVFMGQRYNNVACSQLLDGGRVQPLVHDRRLLGRALDAHLGDFFSGPVLTMLPRAL